MHLKVSWFWHGRAVYIENPCEHDNSNMKLMKVFRYFDFDIDLATINAPLRGQEVSNDDLVQLFMSQ